LSCAEHTTAVPTHTPDAEHWSVRVQRFPSSQLVPVGWLVKLHVPAARLQCAPVWHSVACATQSWSDEHPHVLLWTAQAPLTHCSVVQVRPSLQAEAVRGVSVQRPVAIEQSMVWHTLGAGQTTGLAPWHAPPTQVSVCVHGLLSSQPEPLALAG